MSASAEFRRIANPRTAAPAVAGIIASNLYRYQHLQGLPKVVQINQDLKSNEVLSRLIRPVDPRDSDNELDMVRVAWNGADENAHKAAKANGLS